MRKLVDSILRKFKKADKLDIEDVYLQKYVQKSCASNLDSCEKILGSNESLKRFAQIWDKDREGLMMMLTGIEYEFISTKDFTKEELAALRHVVGNIAMFYKKASEAWYLYEITHTKDDL